MFGKASAHLSEELRQGWRSLKILCRFGSMGLYVIVVILENSRLTTDLYSKPTDKILATVLALTHISSSYLITGSFVSS